jgi:hypothetical protein
VKSILLIILNDDNNEIGSILVADLGDGVDDVESILVNHEMKMMIERNLSSSQIQKLTMITSVGQKLPLR